MYHDYEDEYADIDEEERFHKISKKKNRSKDVNRKMQIRQRRREKDKNREEITKREKYLTDKKLQEEREKAYQEYEDDWE